MNERDSENGKSCGKAVGVCGALAVGFEGGGTGDGATGCCCVGAGLFGVAGCRTFAGLNGNETVGAATLGGAAFAFEDSFERLADVEPEEL